MDQGIIWVIVVIAAIVIVAIVIGGFVMRRTRKPFETRAIPSDLVQNYETRIPEIEQMFVHQPREAVAAARQLVDDMLSRMGYPARMNASERVRDIRYFDRTHSDRYRTAAMMKNDATTEEMRRSLRGLLDMARGIMDDTRKHHRLPEGEEPTTRREVAG
jgi:hypothetical protein